MILKGKKNVVEPLDTQRHRHSRPGVSRRKPSCSVAV
jgi:hypothetical protein